MTHTKLAVMICMYNACQKKADRLIDEGVKAQHDADILLARIREADEGTEIGVISG